MRIVSALIVLLLCLVSGYSQPYILETGPEKEIGLPFLLSDTSLNYRGRYIEPGSGFAVTVFYALDEPQNLELVDKEALSCSPGAVYPRVNNLRRPESLLFFQLFRNASWIGEVYAEEEEINVEPAPSYGIFYLLERGEKEDLCRFIPIFEERLRYYMNVRKNEPVLPMPAVVGAE